MGEKQVSESAQKRPVYLIHTIEDGKLNVVLATRSPVKAMSSVQEDRNRSFTELTVE